MTQIKNVIDFPTNSYTNFYNTDLKSRQIQCTQTVSVKQQSLTHSHFSQLLILMIQHWN